MKFYLYCVTDAAPGVEAELTGLDGQPIEVIGNQRLYAVASRFEGESVPVTRQNVLQHEATVRRIFSTTTVLPFRFGTLVTQSALKSYLKTHENALFDRLGHLRDRVEMSVKIIWQNPAEGEEESEAAIPDFDEIGAGTAFLMFKRQELLGNERLEEEARELGTWLADGVKGVICEELVTIEPRQRLVISASYLVRRSRLADYRSELARLQGERTNLHFLTSGPWPPYTFANIDLEFETHLGVS
jgi:hypothetical protein